MRRSDARLTDRAGQGGDFGKVRLSSGAIAYGKVVSSDALRRRSDWEAAAEAFTLFDRSWSTGLLVVTVVNIWVGSRRAD
jgi:hypothetical protein